MTNPDQAGLQKGPACFCRDCLSDLEVTARRCTRCGSPRLVRHRTLAALTIAHIDCDAFYATVEKRDNPDIADKPVTPADLHATIYHHLGIDTEQTYLDEFQRVRQVLCEGRRVRDL